MKMRNALETAWHWVCFDRHMHTLARVYLCECELVNVRAYVHVGFRVRKVEKKPVKTMKRHLWVCVCENTRTVVSARISRV